MTRGRPSARSGWSTRPARSAAHTGARCVRFASHLVAPGVSIQANMMERPTVPAAMLAAFERAAATSPPGCSPRCVAAEGEGGDVRGRQSAALVVAPGDGGSAAVGPAVRPARGGPSGAARRAGTARRRGRAPTSRSRPRTGRGSRATARGRWPRSIAPSRSRPTTTRSGCGARWGWSSSGGSRGAIGLCRRARRGAARRGAPSPVRGGRPSPRRRPGPGGVARRLRSTSRRGPYGRAVTRRRGSPGVSLTR